MKFHLRHVATYLAHDNLFCKLSETLNLLVLTVCDVDIVVSIIIARILFGLRVRSIQEKILRVFVCAHIIPIFCCMFVFMHVWMCAQVYDLSTFKCHLQLWIGWSVSFWELLQERRCLRTWLRHCQLEGADMDCVWSGWHTLKWLLDSLLELNLIWFYWLFFTSRRKCQPPHCVIFQRLIVCINTVPYNLWNAIVNAITLSYFIRERCWQQIVAINNRF